jgi:hypothetical protein
MKHAIRPAMLVLVVLFIAGSWALLAQEQPYSGDTQEPAASVTPAESGTDPAGVPPQPSDTPAISTTPSAPQGVEGQPALLTTSQPQQTNPSPKPQMPRTASLLPLLALAGLTSLGTALLLRTSWRNVSQPTDDSNR